MNLKQLFEVRSTSNLSDSQIDLSAFGERQLLVQDNGHSVYKRISKSEDHVWLLDIDEHAFVLGVVTSFPGQVKNNVFVTHRGWTDPDYRGKGLITNIMFCLYNKLNYALMCDSVVSPTGRTVWVKLCQQLSITHCYKYNSKARSAEPIDQKQMISDFTNNEDDFQYIIECQLGDISNLSEQYHQMDKVVSQGISWLEKYDFSGLA